jgi:hypothetical protein
MNNILLNFIYQECKEMFGVGNIIIKVKHVRATFRLMNWNLDVENY